MPEQIASFSYRWRDIVPVARLHFERAGTRLIVVDHPGGRPLWFAPLHVFGTARPGEPGTSVVLAHAETHFELLAGLAPGDFISACSIDGQQRRYTVESLRVIDSARHPVWSAALGREELQLMTSCPAGAGDSLNCVITAAPG